MKKEIVKFEKANSAKKGKLTMSKHEPLVKHLEMIDKQRILLDFSEIESVLGFELIYSLKTHLFHGMALE